MKRNQNIQLVVPLPKKVPDAKNACIKISKNLGKSKYHYAFASTKYQFKIQKFVKVAI